MLHLEQRIGDFIGRRWHRCLHPSSSPAIVIGGCGRSGTTLLRVILDSHSWISCGPESELFVYRHRPHGDSKYLEKLAHRFDFSLVDLRSMLRRCACHSEFIDTLLGEYSRRHGKRLWAEKTPRNVRVIETIFEQFPRARFIHMIRDGRDVVCSLREHPRNKILSGRLVREERLNPIEKCVDRWSNDVRAGRAHQQDPRYIELRYEDLVNDAESALRRLFKFLELPWEQHVLAFDSFGGPSRDPLKFPQNPEACSPMYGSAIGRWRKDLTDQEIAYVENRVGDLLRGLGYC